MPTNKNVIIILAFTVIGIVLAAFAVQTYFKKTGKNTSILPNAEKAKGMARSVWGRVHEASRKWLHTEESA